MMLKLGLVFAVLVATSCGQKESTKADRSAGPDHGRASILFLSIDTLGAAHTSLHGYARKTTPHLDALAEEAIVFERCLTNAPFTRASYVSQFTGLPPGCSAIDREEFREKHGRSPRNWEAFHIPEERLTLTELLRDAGYRTAAFVDNANASPALGLGQGFELYDMAAADQRKNELEGGLSKMLPAMLEWVDSLPERTPFFLFVNAADPHKPYLPPEEFRDFFADDPNGESDLEFPVGRGGFGVIDIAHVREFFGRDDVPPRMRTGPIATRYDEEVRAMDEACGELISALRERGLFEQMIFVYSADHGEAKGMPDYKFGHGSHVEQVLHVPFLLRLPNARNGGMRIRDSVQLLDLYPTIADILALDPPGGLPGRSLVPLIEGQPLEGRAILHETGRLASTSLTEGEWRLVVSFPGAKNDCVLAARGRAWLAKHYPDLGGDYFTLNGISAGLAKSDRARRAFREAREALRGPFHELFHLPSDPHLLTDVAQAHPDVVARLKSRMKQMQDFIQMQRDQVRVSVDFVPPEMDIEELKALGYIGDDGEDDG